MFEDLSLSFKVGQWFSKCCPGLATLASPGDLLEMQMLRPHPRPIESNFKGGAQQAVVLTGPHSGDSDAFSRLRIAGKDNAFFSQMSSFDSSLSLWFSV